MGRRIEWLSLMLGLHVRASRAEVVDMKTWPRSLPPPFLRDQDADSH